jgi:hypothetical protein
MALHGGSNIIHAGNPADQQKIRCFITPPRLGCIPPFYSEGVPWLKTRQSQTLLRTYAYTRTHAHVNVRSIFLNSNNNWLFFHMTTEWVSGGGNHFRHHRFTKNGFSLDNIHLVTRKQEIFQNYNKNLIFFHITTKSTKKRCFLTPPRLDGIPPFYSESVPWFKTRQPHTLLHETHALEGRTNV